MTSDADSQCLPRCIGRFAVGQNQVPEVFGCLQGIKHPALGFTKPVENIGKRSSNRAPALFHLALLSDACNWLTTCRLGVCEWQIESNQVNSWPVSLLALSQSSFGATSLMNS